MTTAYELHNLLFFLFGGYFLLFICWKKHFLLAGGCLFASFFIGWRMESPVIVDYSEDTMLSQQIVVLPDTIGVDGTLLRFEGKTKEDVTFQYSAILKSKKAHAQWQNLRGKRLILTTKGRFSRGSAQRNLFGFDQQRYLRYQHLAGQIQLQEWQILGERSQKLDVAAWRGHLLRKVEESFSPKVVSYVSALLLGWKNPAFTELKAVYGPTGLLHLFTISGTHVAFFLGAFRWGLRRLFLTVEESWLPMILIGVVSSVLFGFSLPVLRALLLFLLKHSCKVLKIQLSGMDYFAWVLFTLLLMDPFTLFSASGQLSLLMGWLVLIIDFGQTWRQKLFASQMISLLAVPLIGYYFFSWPLLSGLLTVICLPVLIGVLLPLFCCLLVVVHFCPLQPRDFVWLDNVLSFFEKILQGLGHQLPIGRIPYWLVLIALLLGLWLYQKRRYRWLVALPCLVLPWLSNPQNFVTQVSFIDVGQGDSIVFTAPFKQEVVVVDTGGKMNFPQPAWGKRQSTADVEYTLLPFLQGSGIAAIDKLILTHGDTDHMGDVLALAKHLPIKEIYLAAGSEDHPNLKRMLRQLPTNTKLKLVTKNQQISGYFNFRVLAPEHKSQGENDDSLVLWTQIKDRRFLLTGDLEQTGEEKLVRDYASLPVDVLKVGHHGSSSSSNPKFLAKLAAKEAVISCGLDNRFGHPTPEVLANLKQQRMQIWRTDQQGMIYYQWFLGQKTTQARWVKSSSN